MRHGSRLRIVSDGQLVGFADGKIGNWLSERAGTLDKRDEVLVRYRAVVREASTTGSRVHTERPCAGPASEVVDLPQGWQGAARLKAGVDDDNVVCITFDDGDAVEERRCIPAGGGCESQGTAIGGRHERDGPGIVRF